MIERLGDKGEPVEPKGIAARFRNIVGELSETNWGLDHN
jgi:hypothetical protein